MTYLKEIKKEMWELSWGYPYGSMRGEIKYVEFRTDEIEKRFDDVNVNLHGEVDRIRNKNNKKNKDFDNFLIQVVLLDLFSKLLTDEIEPSRVRKIVNEMMKEVGGEGYRRRGKGREFLYKVYGKTTKRLILAHTWDCYNRTKNKNEKNYELPSFIEIEE